MRNLLAPAVGLLIAAAAVAGHWGLSISAASACATSSLECPREGSCAGWAGYWATGEGFVGISYGLGFGFVALVVTDRILRVPKGGLKTAAAGLAGAGSVWLAVCWLTGCCGSPLLPLYVSWIGGEFLGVTRPLVFGLTVVSVALSAACWWRSRRQGCGCLAQCSESEDGCAS